MRTRTKRHLIVGWSTGFGSIAIGMLGTLIAIVMLEGAARSVVLGVSVALILVGTVLLASTLGWLATRTRGGEVEGWWLPSRDGDR